MKILVVFFSLMLLFSGQAGADAPRTEAQVQVELLRKLEADGYLSGKLAAEAKLKYVDAKQLPGAAQAITTTVPPAASVWERYLSWLNFFKAVAVILVLIAFGGTVRRIARGVWHILAEVPVLVYQLPMLAASIYATCLPESIWASQANYVVLLAAFANIILMVWVLGTHEKLVERLEALLKPLMPFASLVSVAALLYFGLLAAFYQSLIFGFFTAISLSSLLSFGLYYAPGTLFLYFDGRKLSAVVFGHLAVIAGYVLAKASGTWPAWAGIYGPGIEYYCTVALCVGLLCGSSPWHWRGESRRLMGGIFILVLITSMAAYFFLDLRVIGSIVCCFFILYVLEWLGKFSYASGGLVIGAGVLGAALYGLAMLMEKYGAYLILTS